MSPDLRERIVLAMYPASTGGRGHAEALEKADRIVALIEAEFVSRSECGNDRLLREIRDDQLLRAEALLREIRDGKHSIPGCLVQIDRYFDWKQAGDAAWGKVGEL